MFRAQNTRVRNKICELCHCNFEFSAVVASVSVMWHEACFVIACSMSCFFLLYTLWVLLIDIVLVSVIFVLFIDEFVCLLCTCMRLLVACECYEMEWS